MKNRGCKRIERTARLCNTRITKPLLHFANSDPAIVRGRRERKTTQSSTTARNPTYPSLPLFLKKSPSLFEVRYFSTNSIVPCRDAVKLSDRPETNECSIRATPQPPWNHACMSMKSQPRWLHFHSADEFETSGVFERTPSPNRNWGPEIIYLYKRAERGTGQELWLIGGREIQSIDRVG